MTTKKTRREFTDEFKREAVVLLRDSGRPLTQVASELGLEPSVLRRWRSLANGAGQAASAVRPGGAAVPATAELILLGFRGSPALCVETGNLPGTGNPLKE